MREIRSLVNYRVAKKFKIVVMFSDISQLKSHYVFLCIKIVCQSSGFTLNIQSYLSSRCHVLRYHTSWRVSNFQGLRLSIFGRCVRCFFVIGKQNIKLYCVRVHYKMPVKMYLLTATYPSTLKQLIFLLQFT